VRQADRGLDERCERQLPEAPVGLQHARHRTRHAGGEMPDSALFRGLAVRADEHVAARPTGGALAVVEQEGFTRGLPDEHEAAAADVAGLGIHHRHREPRGDGGVDRVAALPQDVAPHLAGDRVAGGDHGLGRDQPPCVLGVGPALGKRPARSRRGCGTGAAARSGERQDGEQQAVSGHGRSLVWREECLAWLLGTNDAT
jgi:hypothetical protein